MGGRFGATLSASGRRLAEAVVTLREHAEPGFRQRASELHNRVWPAIESDGTASMDELVTMRSYDGEVADVWAGDAENRAVRLTNRRRGAT